MRRLLLFLCVIFLAGGLRSQVAKTQVVMLNVTANANGSITLTWPQESWAGTWNIYRRTLDILTWGSALVNVSGSLNTWTDNTAQAGKSYEYLITKTSGGSNSALGYIYAGNKYAEQPASGGLILLIDSNYMKPLSAEITRLQQQLQLEGWQVSTVYAGRKEKPSKVRDRVIAEYDRRKGRVRTLYILGHVPVPYSGEYTAGGIPPPDGHVEGSGNHTGAWPADGYYGDMDAEWYDNAVNMTTGHTSRLYNIPGDGKFDATKFPTELELEVGRVDLYDMPAFSKNDTLLVSKYLNRNHLWRNDQLTTVERALIDNNFGTLNLASTGYHNLTAMIRMDSVFDNRDYFTAQRSGAYLWSYGCGPGSYTSCSGVGTTADFAADSLRNIYTILAGSFFGDWDVQNNLMRASLCRSALACFWGGIPKWYVHHMGLGMNIGYGAKTSMNNVDFYFNGSFNYSQNSVHMALMGDPTLKMRHAPRIKSVTAVSQNNYVRLNWNKVAGKADGYVVYRFDSAANTYYRVNKNHIIKDTFYTDSTNYYNGYNRYVVRAIRLETTASGSWFNLGAGAATSVNHTNAVRMQEREQISLFPNPAGNQSSLMLGAPAGRDVEIRLTDALGRQVCSFRAEPGSSLQTLNLNALATGVYQVTVMRGAVQTGAVTLFHH